MKAENQLDALNVGEGIVRSEAYDADEHANNLTNWQQQYDQVSNGEFYGNFIEMPLTELQVFKEYTSHALRQCCNVWSDSLWFGLPENGHKVSRVNGLEVKDEHVMCRPGATEFELVTPEDFNIYGVVVTQQSLETAAEIQGVKLNQYDHGRLTVPRKSLYYIRYVLNRMLTTEQSRMPKKVLTELVMMSVLEVLKQEDSDVIYSSSFERRKAVVDRAKDYVEFHTDSPATITELCEVANVSRRTLQYAFTSVLGISPIQYIRTSRLNGVRRALHKNQILPQVQQSPIADIASQWGFWHLSQFSKDYKQLFGELPSQTNRSQPEWLSRVQ